MRTDDRLHVDDERARAAALDPSRSFIVQAPAGSGKTELLIQRYLSLLACVDQPEEILAITFTRKAAAEMQSRVLAALRSVIADEQPTEAHERVTFAAARRVLQRDADRNWMLASNPRRMRIQTLDSLNATIARAQPITAANSAAGSTILEGMSARLLYRNAAVLTLDQLTEPGPYRDAARDVLTHLDNDSAQYIDYVARMLETRDQWLPFIGSGAAARQAPRALRATVEQNLRAVVLDHLRRTRTALPDRLADAILASARYAAGQLLDSEQHTHPVCALHAVVRLRAETPEDLPLWQGVAELLLTKKDQWRQKVDKKVGFPPRDAGQKQAFVELLRALRDADELRDLLAEIRQLPPSAYNDTQWGVLLSLFRLLPLATTELKRLFSEQSATDHIEVALAAATALGSAEAPGSVALLLDYQLRHILVDEMQDTSTAQYHLLEALTGGWEPGDGRTLFCVGDPMQSIYRFRNAEVGEFLLARSSGLGNVTLEPLVLRRNFRSGERLVDWYNMTFQQVLPAQDDAIRGAVSYAPATSVERKQGQGVCIVHPLLGASVRQESETGAAVIADLLASHPADTVAVLVQSRTHLPALLALLRERRLDYSAVEIDRLTDLPEIIDILALTRALVHPGDRVAWLALLRSPWAGLTFSDLHALVHDDHSRTIWEFLQDDERVGSLSESGTSIAREFRERLRPFLTVDRARSLRDRVEAAWFALGGPALPSKPELIDNVYRYLEVLGGLERAGSLPDVAELETSLDGERVSNDTGSRLQVMTIHRAKGLQFDHVLLYGLGRTPRRGDSAVMRWSEYLDPDGNARLILSPVRPRAEMQHDPIYRYIQQTLARKDKFEQGRLLYVACTRARKSLHLLGHTGLNADRRAVRPPPENSLLRLLWPSVHADFDAALSSSDQAFDSDVDEPWLTPRLTRLRRPWRVPAVDALPSAAPQVEVTTRDDVVDFYWVGSGARIAGIIVHRWLHLAAQGNASLLRTEAEARRNTTLRWLREVGLAAASTGAVIERVEAALDGIMADARGRWVLSGTGHAELALTGNLDGTCDSVVLDRVRIDDDGTHWIIDYKTSTHEGGNLDAFLAAEVRRYETQLRKYAAMYRVFADVPVRSALYFPLLSKFLEVDV